MFNILKKKGEDDLTFLDRAYTKILKKKPKLFLYLPLASVYCRKGKIEKAISTMQKGVSLRPDHISSNCYLAFLYEKNGETDRAIDIYKKVVSDAPDNYAAHKALSEYYLGLKDKKNALKEIRELARLSPFDKRLQDQIIRIEKQLFGKDKAPLSLNINAENDYGKDLGGIGEEIKMDYILFTLEKWLNNIDKMFAKQ